MSIKNSFSESVQHRYIPDEAPGLSSLELTHPAGGRLIAYYNLRSGVGGGVLSIDDVVVNREKRRNGIGQEMLESVKLFGEIVIQPDIITATIVSRECLEAMKRVFGEDSIDVRAEGDFERPYTGGEDVDIFNEPEGFVRTGASLRYVINNR